MTTDPTPTDRVSAEELASVEGSLTWCLHRHPNKAQHEDVLRADLEILRRSADTVRALQAELAAAREEANKSWEYNNRWVRAAMQHYPAHWAMDPTNPELMIANIVRALTTKEGE